VTFLSLTESDREAMLAEIGVDSIDDLFEVIPQGLRIGKLEMADGVSEPEVLREIASLAAQNRSTDDLICFLGAGAYDHHVPSIVWPLLSRGELATSYTPYQPELSQGVLQALFEYQTMVCELTGLDISNASLYDGGSALSEAVNLAVGATGRKTVVVVGALNPAYARVLATQGTGLGVEVRTVGWGRSGTADIDRARDAVADAAALIVQHPNFFGCLEDVPTLSSLAHQAGAKMIVHYDLTSGGVLESPGALGADVVVAEGQPLGNHLFFGGPYVGVIACRAADVRRLPGRLVGETVDRNGARAFVLTLQAREQHIRREKAASNICTNQTLNALAVAVTLAWLGPRGLRELGELCIAKAHYCRDRFVEVAGAQPLFSAPFFKEFAVRLPADPVAVCKRVAAEGFLAGIPIAQLLPDAGLEDVLLVAVTEKRTRQEIDGLVEAVARACKEVA
jgi:glycine dehydrogenase subunit 1